jgi:hypothetical protein
MASFKEIILNPRIHVATAAGISIIALGVVYKKILGVPVDAKMEALPALLVLTYETVISKKKDAPAARSIYWVVGILLVTAVIAIYELW